MVGVPVKLGMISAMRFLREAVPGAMLVNPGDGGTRGMPEGYPGTNQEPALVPAVSIEGSSVHAVRVPGNPEVGFEAFLDGTQKVEVEGYLPNGVPVISATTAAAIRVRSNRRMITWGHEPPLVHKGVYVPLRYCPGFPAEGKDGLEIIDSAETREDGTWPTRHPAALVGAASDKLKRTREKLEARMAEAWCAKESSPLFIDGSIQGSEIVARSECVVGVVKSHTTIYLDDKDLDVLYGLKRGERTSAVRITPRSRKSVASWYLRLRDNEGGGRDPLFGVVRIEVAETLDITDRANQVSRWVLAEGAPLALPDNRWDKMIYGIRDCEEYLRAIS